MRSFCPFVKYHIHSSFSNPYGGTIISAVDTNILEIENISIPYGQDSIIVEVMIPENAEGIYEAQAVLNNIDISAANDTTTGNYSDYPPTDIVSDPTPVFVQTIEVDVEGTPVFLCPDSMVTIGTHLPENGLEFNWDTEENTQQITVQDTGLYQLYISTACSTDTIEFPVLQDAPYIELDKYFDIYYGEPVTLNPVFYSGSPIDTFFWVLVPHQELLCDTCLTLFLSPLTDTRAHISVYTEAGCFTQSDTYIRLDKSIYAPNVFSPNGDGVNDDFFLRSKNPIPVQSMQIFDRWGGLIFSSFNFETNNSIEGWDGSKNGQSLDAGVYVWKIEYKIGSSIYQLSGDIFLIR